MLGGAGFGQASMSVGRAGRVPVCRQRVVRRLPRFCKLWRPSDGFEGADDGALLAQIERLRPDLLLVGIGCPRAGIVDRPADHPNYINVPVCWSVGALFDLVAGVKPQVPRCLNRLGLEWLWRLMADPSGKWRRYLLGNPLFLARILAQKNGTKVIMASVLFVCTAILPFTAGDGLDAP